MIIYNDWDILEQAICSARSFADELVVVDGAYKWMIPFLERYSQNPDRSNEETISILERHDDFVRHIPGVWLNESAKRVAAYEACSGDIVHLIDADELHKTEFGIFQEFSSSSRVVGEMPSPLLMPKRRFAILKNRKDIGKKPTTFKRAKVSTVEHLSYLWLILPESERALIPDRVPHSVWQKPIGTNYHYSMLRSPKSAINRALFYVFQKYLSPDVADHPNNALAKALNGALSATSVLNAMQGSSLVISFPMNVDQIFLPLEAPTDVQMETDEIEAKMASGLIEHRHLATGRSLLNQIPSCIDVSDLRMTGQQMVGSIKISNIANTIQIFLVDRLEGTSSYSKTLLVTARDSNTADFQIPVEPNPKALVRSMIEILVKLPDPNIATSIENFEVSNKGSFVLG
jgi:hypothetical protein